MLTAYLIALRNSKRKRSDTRDNVEIVDIVQTVRLPPVKPFKIAAIRTQPILTASTLEHIVTPEQVQSCSEVGRKRKTYLKIS